MQYLPLAMIMSQRAVAREFDGIRLDTLAESYPEPVRGVPRTHRARTALAATLYRLARTVEPARCTPAH